MVLIDLPLDILVDSLLRLDEYTILRCQEVCTTFREIITADINLQYKLKLYKSSMIDNPSLPTSVSTAERLEALNTFLDRQKTWTDRWPKGRIELSEIPSDYRGHYNYRSKTLLWRSGPNVISFVKILDQNSPIPYSHHEVELREVNAFRFWVSDESQDLLIVKGYHVDVMVEGLYILSLYDGGKHPNAQKWFISIPKSFPECNHVTIEICGKLVSVSGAGSCDDGQSCVFDWTTGDLHGVVDIMHQVSCILFPTKDIILAVVRNVDMGRVEIHAYRIGRDKRVVVLQFPSISQDLDGSVNAFWPDFSSNLVLSSGPEFLATNTRPYTDPSKAVIAFTMWADYHLGFPWSLTSIFPFSFIASRLDDESSLETCQEIPWGEWPQCTFADSRPIKTFGARVAMLGGTSISIHHFHERVFARQTQLRVPVSHDEEDWNQTIEIPERVQEIKVTNVEQLWMDDDMIIMLRRNGSLEYFRF